MNHEPSYFPEELILLIIESNNHWWPVDLANLCRVSNSWLYPARRKLYRFPRLTTHHACSLLARSLKENTSLCSLVRGVCLQPMPCYSNHSPPACVESLRTILGIDGLQSIALGGELAIAAGRYLHMVTTPGTVTDIRVDGAAMLGAMRRGPSLEWDEILALKFSRLQSLRLSNLTLDVDMDTSLLPDSSLIRTLVLDTVDISYGRLTLFVGENTVLECLHVTTEDGSEHDDDIREILMTCEVHSLEYKVTKSSHFEMPLFHNEMGPLPNLKRLQLEGVYVDGEVLRCIQELCTGLDELELRGRGVMVGREEIAGVLASVGRS